MPQKGWLHIFLPDIITQHIVEAVFFFTWVFNLSAAPYETGKLASYDKIVLTH